MSSSSEDYLRHPVTLDVKSATVAPPLEEAIPSCTPSEELFSQHKLIASCPAVTPDNMGASESVIEEIVSGNVLEEESSAGGEGCSEEQNAQLQTGPNKLRCADVLKINDGVAGHHYGPVISVDQDCGKCDRPENEPVFSNATVKSNESEEVVEPVNSTLSDICESTRKGVDAVETGEIKGDMDGLGNRLDSLSSPSSVTCSSPTSFSPSENQLIEESLMRAMILKYFAEHRSDSDNSLPAYYVSEEKYEKLWLECPEASCEHKRSPSLFSQLCASNFIQLGASSIGYPASPWFEGKYPESTAHPEKSLDLEPVETKPMRLQIWITEKSHPTQHDVKNDIFLKMCAVEEINRSDLMCPYRAYLTTDGNIEYNLNSGNQKEGIADFIDAFQQTHDFGLNRKKYSPSWESVIDALSRTPHYVSSEQVMSDSISKYRYRGKRGGRRHKKSTSSEGLEDDKTDFCDKSAGQTPKHKIFGHDTSDIPEGTDVAVDDLNRGASVEEPTRIEQFVGLDVAFSELSVNDESFESNVHGNNVNERVNSLKNDVSVSASISTRHPSDGILGTNDEPLDSSNLILDESSNGMDEKSMTSPEGSCHYSPGQISKPKLPGEVMFRNSQILNTSITGVLVVAENQVENGIQGSSGTAPSADPTNHTSAVMEQSLPNSVGTVEKVCSALPVGFTETPVEHELMCEAYEVVMTLDSEDIRVDEVSLSETDDSHVGSNDEKPNRNGDSNELDASMKGSRLDEELEEVIHFGSSASHSSVSGEETVSSSGSSTETEWEDEGTCSKSCTFHQSSSILPKSVDKDSDVNADRRNMDSFSGQKDIMRQEKIELGSLPNSLSDIGLQVFHPRGHDVVSRLSKIPDTYWIPGSNCSEPNTVKSSEEESTIIHRPPPKTVHRPPSKINTVKSSEEVSSILMKALEKTCFKREDITADRSKGPTKDAASAQNTSSSAIYIPPWKRVQAFEKETKPTSEKSGESSISTAKREIVVEQLNPTETGEAPSNSAKRSVDINSSGKVANEGASPVIKSLPSHFGKLPSSSQGFARHALSDLSTSKSDLLGALELQLAVGATSPGSSLVSSTLGAASSKVPVSAGPSSSVVPAPPMGAIPVRPPLLGTKMSKVGNCSNRPDEFGRLVAESIATMSGEQRTHAINVIRDVLTEGNNNTLCQYTRLSGVLSGLDGGKEVFRMGPSHALETQQPLIHYGFPPCLPPTQLALPRLHNPLKDSCQEGQREECKSLNPLPPTYKTPASDQKPLGSQNVASNQNIVPPTQDKLPTSLKKVLRHPTFLPKKAVLEQKTSQGQKKPKKKSLTNPKPSSANQGTSTTNKTVVISKLAKKAVENQQGVAKSAVKSQTAGPSQNPVPKAPTGVSPVPKNQNPATKSQNHDSASQKAKKKLSAAGNPIPASEESNRKKKQRKRAAKFCPNKAIP